MKLVYRRLEEELVAEGELGETGEYHHHASPARPKVERAKHVPSPVCLLSPAPSRRKVIYASTKPTLT